MDALASGNNRMIYDIMFWLSGFFAGGLLAVIIMALMAAARVEDKELEIWRD